MASNKIFGWDLLYRSVESEIKCNEDVLLSFVHFILISNDFKCIGIGESKTLDGSESASEVMPRGWNDCYSLRYKNKGRLFILKCIKLDDGILINLTRIDERSVSSLQLNSASVASRTGSLLEMIPNHPEVIKLVKNELIDKVVISKKSKEVSSQTEANKIAENIRVPRGYDSDPNLRAFPPLSRPVMPNVGEFDLYPFGGLRNPILGPNVAPPGGGGMLFDPPRGPNYPGGPNIGVPPHSIPPGARFDPFRPPEPDRIPRRGNNPDNDELPPPGYDDMFM